MTEPRSDFPVSLPPLPDVPVPVPVSTDAAAVVATGQEEEPPNLGDVENESAFSMALDDVHTRFILNLPPEELSTSDRIFFQLEQAYWFYDDFYCDAEEEEDDDDEEEDDDERGATTTVTTTSGAGGRLLRFPNLRAFCQTMFRASPLLSPRADDFDELWEEFAAYKRRISTYGTILLNRACDRVVMCRAWNGASWTFPAGKVNQNETGERAGARETYEETGFDVHCRDGLTREWNERSPRRVTWSTRLRPKNALTYVEEGTGKRRTCYVCRGVPEDFPFAPVARKEVSDVRWFPINGLPKKTFAALPFISQLRRWIRRHGGGGGGGVEERNKRTTPVRGNNNNNSSSNNHRERKSSRKKNRSGNNSNNNSRGRVREGDAVTESRLARPGDANGWTEKDMFDANERLSGRRVAYDGNPHTFSESMRASNPHRFHVVGGAFMNTDATSSTPPPRRETTPRRRTTDDEVKDEEDGRDLEPFFSEEGVTPWGERVDGLDDAKQDDDVVVDPPPPSTMGSNEDGKALLSLLRKNVPDVVDDDAEHDGATTDDHHEVETTPIATTTDDFEHLLAWVRSLETPPPNKLFGEFRIDVDDVMEVVADATTRR